MKNLNTRLLLESIKSDLFIVNRSSTKEVGVAPYATIFKNIKQIVQVLYLNKNLPILLVCQNRQHDVILKKYILPLLKSSNIALISLDVALIIKTPCIFILFDINDEVFVLSKLLKNLNSMILLLNNSVGGVGGDFYHINIALKNLKQLIFLVALIKQSVK